MSDNNLKSSKSKSAKNKKLHMFGVFLILSFIFLVLTKFSKTYNETITLNLDYKNVPEDVTITSPDPLNVNVAINAVGFRILLYYFKNKNLTLDMENDVLRLDSLYVYSPNINDKNIRNRIGYEVEILSVRPDTLKIPYGVLDTKTVPIILDSEVTFSPGYDLTDSIRLTPDSVKIIGPSNLLRNIKKIDTEKLTILNLENELEQELTLLMPEEKNLKLSTKTTKINIEVSKFTEGTLQIPVTIVNLPNDIKINYFPKTIPVSYYVNLNDFKDINPERFSIECDYNSVKDTQKSFFTPNLVQIPEKVRSARLKLDKVEFIVTK